MEMRLKQEELQESENQNFSSAYLTIQVAYIFTHGQKKDRSILHLLSEDARRQGNEQFVSRLEALRDHGGPEIV